MSNASSHKVANLSFLTDCHRTGHIWLIFILTDCHRTGDIWLIFILKDNGCYCVTDVPIKFRHKRKCMCLLQEVAFRIITGWIELDLIIVQ